MLDQKCKRKLGKCGYFVLLGLGPISRMEYPIMDDIIYEDEGYWLMGGYSAVKKSKEDTV